MAKDFKALAKEWFDAAESDYNYAKVGLSQEIIFPQVAFLSQQVAEKFLKGFLVIKHIEPPRIHELPKLLDECIKIDSDLESLRDACELLTGFYVETRYPPDIQSYTKEEIGKAFKFAELIRQKIKEKVGI